MVGAQNILAAPRELIVSTYVKFALHGVSPSVTAIGGDPHESVNFDSCPGSCSGFQCISIRHSRHPASSAGRWNHASALRMWSGQDPSEWCLRGENHYPPYPPRIPQVCAMAWRRLRSLVLRQPASEKEN